MKDFSIIIPTKDRGEVFEKTLRTALLSIENFNAEIIVVNDSSQHLQALKPHPKLTYLNNPKSGAASARNFGALHADAILLLFLDDDMLLSKDHLDVILSHSLKEPTHIYLLNWTYPPELEATLQRTKFGRYLLSQRYTSLEGWLGSGKHWKQPLPFEHSGIASYCLPILKKTFMEVGGYDEDIPYAGAEDADFTERLKKHKLSFFILPFATLFHNEEDRIGLTQWLQRKKRGGITLRVATEKGNQTTAQHYTKARISIYRISLAVKSIFTSFAYLTPNFRVFDPLYRKLIHFLTAISLFEGYQEGASVRYIQAKPTGAKASTIIADSWPNNQTS